MALAEVSIKRPWFITCIVVVMLAVGGMSLLSLPVDLFPDVTFPIVVVNTQYQGAGPSEVETLISKPLEDEISTVSGIKRVTSKNLEGVSMVIAEFYLGNDIKYAEQQVRDKVSIAKAKLPKEIEEPVIQRIDPADQPVITLGLTADLSQGQLYDLADQTVKTRIQQVNDVGKVEIVGGRKREIQVQLDRAKANSRQLSVSEVANQISSSGQNVPSGKVQNRFQETVFRSLGEFQTVGDIGISLVNLYGNEVPTRVNDIGQVLDTLEDEKTRAYVNGKQTLFLDVFRQTGSNTLAVVNGVKGKLDQVNQELGRMGKGAKLTVVRDASVQIQDNVDDVKETIFLGIILTVIVVYFFLANGRSTIITGLALPNSLIGAFILMYLFKFSINIVSLLSLTLAIGLLIDDAIVVRENIFRHIEAGEDPKKAAIVGTKEVQLAVIATTLVVMATFGPVAFMAGMVGQFMRQFGLTVCFAMAISLFDALTIAPMLSNYFAGGATHGVKTTGIWGSTMGRVLKGFDSFQTRLENGYERVLKKTLRFPKTTIITSFLLLIVAMMSLKYVPKAFIPPQDNGEFVVNLDLPPGTDLDGMTDMAFKVDNVIRANKEVNYTALTVGGRNGEPEKANIYIRLIPSKERKGVNTSAMKEKIRDQLKSYRQANPQVGDYDASGSGNNRQFTMRLLGSDSKQLEEQSTKILEALRKDNRLKDLDTSYRPGKPEFQVKLRPDSARIYGVNTGMMGAELRAEVEGVKAAKFRENGQEYDVRVRLKNDQRDLKRDFKLVKVPNVNGRLVRLTDVADGKMSQGPATIDRQDRSRYIEITADIAANAGLGDIITDTIKRMNSGDLKLPPGVRYAFVGNSENFQEMGTSVLVSFGFGILFIFLVLTSLYESPITPITILLSLPMALAGAFLGLFIFQESLNLFSILGIVMLIGVASKNAILLVDHASHSIREEGMERIPALIKAGRTRLRPILMTSMALIAGTLPVAMGLNEASKQRTSMGIVIIGGMISSTILALIVIPSVFLYVDRLRVWATSMFHKLQAKDDRALIRPQESRNDQAHEVSTH
ncbi:MAG: efflux RND transporter permease subunit [Bdellovibrionia bacterium]